MNGNNFVSDLPNNETKKKNGENNINNDLSKEFHEDILNFKLSLRKEKIHNKLMTIRLKKQNKSLKITNKKKLDIYKKLFEVDKIKEIKDKIIDKNENYMKDKKIIELLHLYSQHINHDENIQKIFDLNNNILIDIIFKEIIKDINSCSINLELFDYYLLILGNFFIYIKFVYENNNKDYMNLFLNILSKNSNLQIYNDGNFDIINDTLWLIHLYIYFRKSDYLNHFSYIMKGIEYFLSNNFLSILNKFYKEKNNDKIFLTIIKDILSTIFNIYLIIFEEIVENIKLIPNFFTISNETFQNCFDNIINILDLNLFKNIYDENITDILSLIFSINKNIISLSFSNNKFLEVLISLFNNYKYEKYDNNKISQNLIIILNKLIDNYYDDTLFWTNFKESDIIPTCIQYYLKNGYLINMTLVTLNLFFKYSMSYNKIIIKCINYKIIDIVSDILIKTENNQKNFYHCLNLLTNSYYFLENYLKNPDEINIMKYFNISNGLLAKLKQLKFSENIYISEISSDLYKKLNKFDM